MWRGPVQVTVTNSNGTSDPVTVTRTVRPGILLFGSKYAVAQHYPDYGYSSNPSMVPGAVAAKPGDILILWGTGFGPTNPAVPAGLVPPPTGPSVTGGGVPVTVTVGGVKRPFDFRRPEPVHRGLPDRDPASKLAPERRRPDQGEHRQLSIAG